MFARNCGPKCFIQLGTLESVALLVNIDINLKIDRGLSLHNVRLQDIVRSHGIRRSAGSEDEAYFLIDYRLAFIPVQ